MKVKLPMKNSFKFYDFYSHLTLEGKLYDVTNIDVSKLKKGRYILKIKINQDTEETHHIIIN